jgi:hypothetical protein
MQLGDQDQKKEASQRGYREANEVRPVGGHEAAILHSFSAGDAKIRTRR